jgi:hypothetical protein
MNTAIDAYRVDRVEESIAVAKTAVLAYIDAIRRFRIANRDVDLEMMFSNPTLMTRAVIEDVKRIISGRGLNLPDFLRVTSDGSVRVTSDDSYRVYSV